MESTTRTVHPTGTGTRPQRTVLISGASIAGPTLAYWLHRYGFAVTVVERASSPRGGGYPIDLRGSAIEVARRMGILPQLQDAHLASPRVTFLDADGGAVASLDGSAVAGSVEGRDLEVRRGDLTGILHASVRDDVELLFDDSIEALDQTGHGVDVAFRSGKQRTFDLVLGADGIHSRTRALAFGPEERFDRYLGYCVAVFTVPNPSGLARELRLWNTPGSAAALYAAGDGRELYAFLTFHQPERPPLATLRDPAARSDLVARTFAGAGWEVPRLVGAMRDADDLFFDVVSQIRMPSWSTGRVALAGDAAYAPSFLTGQGSSLALAGSYMLADALATHEDHTEAFAAYERGTRQFVTMNQALVDGGGATLFPTTAEALERRNAMLRDLVAVPEPAPRPAHSALTLPEPAPMARTA